MENDVEFSVVIPCLNEEKTLPIVIKKSLVSFERLKIKGEVIVADNGSTDQSREVAKKMGARVIEVSEKGYGNALIGGMNGAKGKYLIMGDADDSYNFEEIDDFVKGIREGNDVVMGTRLKGRIEKGAMPFLHHYLGTPILTKVLNLFFGTKISDCNCGMRALTKEAFEKMKLQSPGMEFASEMMIKAGLLKLKIKEIPITLYRDKRDKAPHLNTWSDGWRHLRFMFLYSPTYLFLVPGIFLFALGLIVMTPLVGGPLKIGGQVFDYHSALFGSMFVILGYQIINMGIFAKAYARNNEFKVNDEFIEKFYRIFSLERGLIFGLLVFLAGLGFNIYVVVQWATLGFANLSRAGMVAFASTLMIIGLQTVFSAFFLSVMKR